MAAGKQHMMLTVERPPEKAHAAIVAYETWEGCGGAFAFASLLGASPGGNKSGSKRSPSGDADSKEQLDAMLAGRTTHTVVLSREAGGAFPCFGFKLATDAITVDSVEAGSPAEKGGVQAGDVLTKVGEKDIKDLKGKVCLTYLTHCAHLPTAAPPPPLPPRAPARPRARAHSSPPLTPPLL